ncbi:MAG: VOC family protein [Bdellovibrionales bacterium]|nr:VOC family protein [Bdellovibrionales bacterium]
MKVKLSSVFVNDQNKALEFYTKILGFEKKVEVPTGEYKWLTVGQENSEFELLLEPNAHPAAKGYQNAIYTDGIPATMFFVDDMDAEFKRLTHLGVKFKSEPATMGNVKIAIFDDTCGNFISLCQQL